MSGKTIFDGASPKTQSLEAVKSLLAWKGRAIDPLPQTVEFTHEGGEGRLLLVLSNKRDTYYVVTPANCSCPAKTYNPGQPCKHQRKFFGAKLEQAMAASESIRPTGEWVGPNGEKANGPVEA